jgi:hypothetical protein
MKHIRVALFVALVSLGTVVAAPPDKTFRGEIMDIQCAKMGSHDVMIKRFANSLPARR